MSDIYEFDASISVMAKSKKVAADIVLERCLEANIAISLHEEGTLNVRRESCEVKSAFFAGYVYGCDHGQSPFDPKYTDVTAYEEWKRVSEELPQCEHHWVLNGIGMTHCDKCGDPASEELPANVDKCK